MKEIVIISGKGGTGKTSITASFAYLAGKEAVIADCDVDAADMHILMQPKILQENDFYSGELAIIDEVICTQCGKCFDVCRFDAVKVIEGIHTIDEISCEGCGYCSKICPVNAIDDIPLKAGKWFISNSKVDSAFVHAKLDIGADNSGKLVAQVKNIAKEIAVNYDKDYIIVDGSPGTGCPVVSSLSGANFVVLVTEPTVSGLHDLQRVYELVKKFHLPAGCIINKYDLNKDVTNQIIEFLNYENITHLANLPYSQDFTKAMVNKKTIVETEYNNEIKQILIDTWEKIKLI